MGIPSFFRTIIQNDSNVLIGASLFRSPIRYFYIDFNSIIYHCLATCRRDTIPNEPSSAQLIQKVLETLRYMINDVVKPTQYAYISIDGIAPRAKMVQQRSRRYKSSQWDEILRKKEQELNLEKKKTYHHDDFSTSHISPGTEFMMTLQCAILTSMKQNQFHTTVYLNDSNSFGEGEHKFLPLLRQLATKENLPDNNIVIYSPDGDMISLSLLTHRPHIYIMRIPDPQSPIEARFLPQEKYIYTDCDRIRRLFYEQLTQLSFFPDTVQELSVLNDYNFLLFMVGNDFVPSLPFLKIRAGGLDLLIRIYHQLRPQFEHYLIECTPEPVIHMDFFKALLFRLSQCENSEMKREYHQIVHDASHPRHRHRIEREKQMTELDIFTSRYQHLSFFHPDHPEYTTSTPLLKRIRYDEREMVWKRQYYQYFTSSSLEEQELMVRHYFESLVFTLRYYWTGCPSYSWYYPHRVSPLPSDMYSFLEKHPSFDLNHISFENNTVEYTPFTQLLLILPPQMSHLLPPNLRPLLKEHAELYPTTFEVDKLAGIKYIYCEAILPEIDDSILFDYVRSKQSSFTKEEQERNQVRNVVYCVRQRSKS